VNILITNVIKQYHKAVEEYRKNKDYKKALDICYLILNLDFKDSKALRMKKELIALESQEIFEIDYEEENLY